MASLKSTAKNFINWSLDILFPKHCLGCRKPGEYLCAECLAKTPVSKSVACFICGKRSPTGKVCGECKQKNHPAIAGLFVASDWSNKLLRQIIYEHKYRFVKELSLPLAGLMIKFLEQNLSSVIPAPSLSTLSSRPKGGNPETNKLTNCPTDKLILLPVPLHPRRLAWRGFNQAALLTRLVGEYFKIPIAENILTRGRFTLPQMNIKDRDERAKNISGAFCLNNNLNAEAAQKMFAGKTIILVDDISTTGSTLQECARALKKLKPREIWGLVLARG